MSLPSPTRTAAAEAKVRAMAAGYRNVKSCQEEYEALSLVLASLDDLRAARAELDDLRPGDECPVCANTV